MFALFFGLLSSVQSCFRSRAALQAEILALRHQLLVLQRSSRNRRLCLQDSDRILWAWLSRLWPGWRSALLIVKPETVIAWHRKGFRLYWTWRSRMLQGRPCVPREVRDLSRKMSLANPRWGAPRIHGELLKLGIEVSPSDRRQVHGAASKATFPDVAHLLEKSRRDLVSADFFVVPTAAFRVLFVFVILSHDRRRRLHFGVTSHPTAEWTAQRLREAFPWDSAPRYLLRHRDRSYGGKFHEAARRMGIRQVLTAPQSPWQNAYVERLIGFHSTGVLGPHHRPA